MANQCFVIGVAGGSGSGKSTLAGLLAERLSDQKVTVIGADRFFIRPLPRMISPATGLEMEDYNCPESIDYDALLEEMRKMKDECDVLIVEGNGILYFEKLRKEMNLSVFVDLPIEERMYRRIARNIKAGRGTMEEIASFYLDSARFSEAKFLLPTKRFADLVVEGHNFQEKAVDVIEAYVRTKI